MVRIRSHRKIDQPPPLYQKSGNILTVALHYGGKFNTLPHAYYSGGQVIMYDFVESKNMNMATLDNFSEKGVGQVSRKYYILISNGFKSLSSDGDVNEWTIKHMPLRELHIYVDTEKDIQPSLQGSCNVDQGTLDENVETVMGESDEKVDAETHCKSGRQNGGETDMVNQCTDDSDGDYDMEHESSDDDELFDQHVDQTETLNENIDSDTNKSSDAGEDDMVHHGDDFTEGRVSDALEEGPTYPVSDTAVMSDANFEIGMVFHTKDEFKRAVQCHAIRTRRTVKFTKNDLERVYVKCKAENCDWKIHLIKMRDDITFHIREYNPNHACPSKFEVGNVKAKWLAETYLQRFKSDPKTNVKAWREDVIRELNCHVSENQAYRAKRKALDMIQDTSDCQYSKPNFGRGAGGPSKARRREPDEPAQRKHKRNSEGKQAMRLKRQQTVKRRKCGEPGHESSVDDELFEQHVDQNYYPVFNPAVMYDPTFEIGMIFSTKAEFKRAVQCHAIRTRRTVKFTKNDLERVYVKCKAENCDWKIHLIKMRDKISFQIRKYNPKHACPSKFEVGNLKSSWLAEKYLQRFKSDPNMDVKAWREDVIRELDCHVSEDQAYRAKRKALAMIQGECQNSTPPNFDRGAGRPSKARRKKPDEPAQRKHKKNSKGKQVTRSKRQWRTVKCRNCGEAGHYVTTCKKGRVQTGMAGEC